MSRILYFAYGWNLDLRQFWRCRPGAQVVGRARLPDHRLAFTRYSRNRRGGVAHIVAQPHATVLGVVRDS